VQDTKYKHRGFFGRIPSEPHALVDRMTPTAKCIVLCHLGIPEIDNEADWVLEIGGLVERPIKLDLAQLKGFPKTTIASIHQCAGSPLAPRKPTQRICNVTWGGVRLDYVLGLVGIKPSARFVWSRGIDEGEFGGVNCGAYLKDIPIERASGDVLLAYEMNGTELLPEHGYPLRLVVPGFYGTNSVKWLCQIDLAPTRAPGPFTTTWYNDRTDDNQTRPVWSIAPQSVIVWPAPETELRVGEWVQVWGWAWADHGVAKAEISFDDGNSWLPCRLEKATEHSWQKFVCDWKAEAAVALTSRALAWTGTGQPKEGERNAFYCVPIKVF
jgi:DMSO/TMAO reductase YedYZ molybdopterin-dependent catalytic subunit